MLDRALEEMQKESKIVSPILLYLLVCDGS